MSDVRGLRRVAVLALALLVAGIAPAGASAGTSDGNHCIAPWGADLNEAWGVSESIVWFFCTELSAGQDWRVAQAWGMNTSFKKVPKGFVPAGDTPLDDFRAKFVGTKVIVDPGTPHERITAFTNAAGLLVTVDADGAGVNGVTLGTLEPLSVGRHLVESYWTMRAMHCDGFGRSIESNCLAAGDSLALSVEIEVTAGQE